MDVMVGCCYIQWVGGWLDSAVTWVGGSVVWAAAQACRGAAIVAVSMFVSQTHAGVAFVVCF